MSFSHLDKSGQVRMVDISRKQRTSRRATATGKVLMPRELITLILDSKLPKGDVLAAARIAGITAAKKTSELIPLTHNIPLDFVGVEFVAEDAGLLITAQAKAGYSTGVEMEALTAVSVAALTIYDMCKSTGFKMTIGDIHLIEKVGGKSDQATDFRPRTAVVVISDRVAAGQREDKSGAILQQAFKAAGCEVDELSITSDDPDAIRAAIADAREAGAELIITTGGTGFGPRDNSFAAVAPLMTERMPGVEEALHAVGRMNTPTAMLSRLAAGLIDGTVLVCLPGSTGAASDAVDVLIPAIFHFFHVRSGGGHGTEEDD